MKFLPEHKSKEVLEKYGIKTARCIFVDDEDAAVNAAREIGYPVVMKIVSDEIIHKSQAGGVLLNLRSDDEVRKGFRRLMAMDSVYGVTVQPMLEKGIEVIVGVIENEQFGSVIMFGLGGIFVEVFRDVSFRLIPITKRDAMEMIGEIRGHRIIKNNEMVAELLVKISEVAIKENIVEMDLNPIFVYENDYAVVDARMWVGKRREFEKKIGNLDSLFYPKSVAVIGASRTVGKPGYNIVWNLKQHGFKGKIYPVNPNADRILDLKCYPAILDIPDKVDLAIIAVPARIVPQIMKDCAEKGVKGVVIVSSGFSEEGEKGAAYEREVIRIAKKSNIRIFGPNTTGVLNTDNGFITTFAILPTLRYGNIGIIAQTGLFLGIMMTHVATNHPSIGFSKVIGMGNKIDVEDYEVLDFLLRDRNTKVIGMYIEGFRNGRAFYEVAKGARKPIVVFKSGRSEYGQKAALSHTASLCGDDNVFDAVCRQANIIRVFNFEEMFNVTKALSLQPLPKGDRVAVVHYTGSGCVQGADAVYFANLKLAELESRTVKKIEEVTPDWHGVNNPIDIWPMVEYFGPYKAYNVTIEALLNDENVDALVVALWAGSEIITTAYHPDFSKLREFGKPIYFVVEGARDAVFETKNSYELNGFPVYPDVITAVGVLGKVTAYAKKLKERSNELGLSR